MSDRGDFPNPFYSLSSCALALAPLRHPSRLGPDYAGLGQRPIQRARGLRLVLRTVSRDDPSSYHSFCGDETSSLGTDFTFFDVPCARDEYPGLSSITGTSLRARDTEPLKRWTRRDGNHDVRRTALQERAGWHFHRGGPDTDRPSNQRYGHVLIRGCA
ncbi:MAG: hypothetical protein ABEL04_01235 [Salinibacter sp.]|uniref:hypothetical protein n=1 Tax=Salinibacter sp. TaxID=2065818 RepID=UPI0035D512F1